MSITLTTVILFAVFGVLLFLGVPQWGVARWFYRQLLWLPAPQVEARGQLAKA